MKRFIKLSILIMAIIFAFSATAIFAFASVEGDAEASTYTPKDPIRSGYFQLYSASTGTAVIKANSSFSSTLASASDGDVITLLSDVYTESKSTTNATLIEDGSAKSVYLDLNGYTVKHHRNKSGQSFIQIDNNANMYVNLHR